MHAQLEQDELKNQHPCPFVELSACTLTWTHVLAGMRSPQTGLVGNTLDVDTRTWVRTDSSIGAGIDSFYEYLLKVPACLGFSHCADILALHNQYPELVVTLHLGLH